jgi:hypothetical protein
MELAEYVFRLVSMHKPAGFYEALCGFERSSHRGGMRMLPLVAKSLGRYVISNGKDSYELSIDSF